MDTILGEKLPIESTEKKRIDAAAELYFNEVLSKEREQISLVFHCELTDAQWDWFSNFAKKTAIPMLILGYMRGYNTPEGEGGSVTRTVEGAVKYVRMFETRMIIHDITHVAEMRYHSGVIQPPLFIQGPDPDTVPPAASEEGGINLPYKLRSSFSADSFHSECRVSMFGGHQVRYDEDNMVVVSMALFVAHKAVTPFYVETKAASSLEIDKVYTQKIAECLDADEYAEERAFEVYVYMTAQYIIGTLYQYMKGGWTSLSESEILAVFKSAQPYLDSAIATIPSEIRRLYDYVHRYRDEIRNGGPQLFDLLVAMAEDNHTFFEEHGVQPDRLLAA